MALAALFPVIIFEATAAGGMLFVVSAGTVSPEQTNCLCRPFVGSRNVNI
jgi:hypothetical protein